MVKGKSECDRILYYDKDGKPVKTRKKQFRTFEDAVKTAKKMNSSPAQIHKIMAYKCKHCLKFHVGNSDKIIKR